MKNIFLILVLMLIADSSNGQVEWFDGVGFSGNVFQGKTTTDNQGNTYSVGSFSNYIYLETGAGAYYAIGEIDVYVKKIDSNGNFIWGRTFGGSLSDRAQSVSVDSQGDILITGFFEDSADLDPSMNGVFNVVSHGDRDVFFVKLTSDGDFVWGKSIGTTGSDEGVITEMSQAGNYWISGIYSSTYIDLDPGPGIAGQSAFASKGSFFVELNLQGDYVRGFALSSTSLTISGIGSTENNGLCVSGYFTGPLDIDPGLATEYISSLGPCANCSMGFVVKIDSLGVMDWYQVIGDGVQNASSKGGEVEVSENGDVYAYGMYIDSLMFYSGGNLIELFPAYPGFHGYLMKLSSEGVLQWANSIDCEYIETGAMALQGDEVILTGGFRVKVDFDPSSAVVEMTNAAWTQDGFIASYDTLSGSFKWVNVLTTEVNGYVMFKNVAYDNQSSFYGSGKCAQGVDFDPSPDVLFVEGANGSPFVVKYDNTLDSPVVEGGQMVINVFPNPATDQLFIQLNALESYNVELLSQTGQRVYHIENCFNTSSFDVRLLAKGIYILKVETDNKSTTQKLVIN